MDHCSSPDSKFSLEEEVAMAHYPIPYAMDLAAGVECVLIWSPLFVVKYKRLIGSRLPEALISPAPYIRMVQPSY